MAEIKTPYGTVIGLIPNPESLLSGENQKAEDKPAEAVQRPKRTRRTPKED